jgi:hypothetical protein
MKKTLFLTILFLFNIVSSADWYDDVRLGTPEYNGTGCPAGSAAVSLTADAKALSILFSSFVVEAGGFNSDSARKNCNIAVPVHVPNGYSVSVFQIDYRGFNSLPVGAWSRFNVEYFFAGYRGPQFQKSFQGPLADDFLIRNTLTGTTMSWSKCGEDVILRTNPSLFVSTQNKQEAFSSVDSADVNAALIFNLVWRSCEN